MALTRSDAMGFWLWLPTSLDLGRFEDCIVPKQLGWAAGYGWGAFRMR